MILLVLTTTIFLALLAATLLKPDNKVIALAVCVILLVLCNFANEVAAANQQTTQRQHVQRDAPTQAHQLTPAPIAVLNNQTAEERAGELLEEEREMVGYLAKRWQGREYALVHFQALHKSRLKLVVEVANHRINRTDSRRPFQLYPLDYKHQGCDRRCLRKTVQPQHDAYTIILAENIKNAEELSDLQEIYTLGNVTIIFQNLPRFFALHTISRLTYRFPFSNNYLPKILEQHPSKTIEFCSLYRTFDYQFYSASLTVPLLELCSRAVALPPAVRCVKRLINEEKMRVPESWVKKCLSEEGHEGLLVENGWVGLRKEHFWSGRMNKTAIPEQEQM